MHGDPPELEGRGIPDGGLVDLGNAKVGLVVDVAGGVPTVVYWGEPGPTTAGVAALVDTPVAHGGLDSVGVCSIVPLHADGWPGRPGLLGRRGGGRDWAPRFVAAGVAAVETVSDPGGPSRVLETVAFDVVAGLELRCRLVLDVHGVLCGRASVTNTGSTRYLLDALTVTLPVPDRAAELVTLGGRWVREAHERRRPWVDGAFVAENRSGRTSHESVPLVWAVEPGAGEWHGEVWGVHLAWSGNHVLFADRTPGGQRYLQVGELLHPGEVCLEPGASYTTPDVLAVHASDGFTPASWGFHRRLRSRPHWPGVDRPRPVVVNTWEAVYFDHDADRLRSLADAAAAVGAERFVLDDGWFGGRRDDRRGLGDWWVAPDVYPEGLGPLISHVRSLGMEFGIWVEPEMVNPDSDLYRSHPEWVLVGRGYDEAGVPPVLGRHQLVLDLTRPEAFGHVLAALDRLLSDHDISFVKWDMNRPHVHASGATGAAATRAQTLAFYALLDELRARHPGVEFESCASGGGRVDHGVLDRAERFWASDCIDPLERQTIERGWSMFVPPEAMGSHIGGPRSHTTGRRHALSFRAATAFFGHLGVEWDISGVTSDESGVLAGVIELHRSHRALLHGGDAVRFDLPPESGAVARGVYAADRSEAIVSWAQLVTAAVVPPPRWLLPGLDQAGVYEVRRIAIAGDTAPGPAKSRPRWVDEPVTVTGADLARVGLQPPVLFPERAVLVHLVRLPDGERARDTA
jgi:alpha-galactosidase